jgi:hypothetical protein
LNKLFVIIIISIIITGIITIPSITEQLAKANTLKKIHFTETITSSQDPGQGHEDHQIALILSPNKGTLYTGSMTFTASEPLQIVVLHEIVSGQAKGQPTWTVDGKTMYAWTSIDPKSNSGSIEFTGAALALHTPNSKPFTATVSIDGWIRGQPTEVVLQKLEIQKEEPSLQLARASVLAKIPLHKGLFEGKPVYYIITDTNDETSALEISKKQNWLVTLALPLSNTPKEALGKVYMFKDGVTGNGIYGFQDEVFSSTPTQRDDYNALRSVTHVMWKRGQNPEILNSTDAIIKAKGGGRIELEETNVIINMPQIIWPDGQMTIKKDKILKEGTQYIGGQILDVNTENMTVTFVAHRGWGPEGKTIYYIITDVTPSGPAEMMGVSNSPVLAKLTSTSAAVDLFQFKDGIKGTGPLGFQPIIAAAIPGDKNYSPIWRVFTVSWNDPSNAKVLETKNDIDSFRSEGLIAVSLARPMNSEYIVNHPFIDPFQYQNSTSKNG